jgi:hypothetical protein
MMCLSTMKNSNIFIVFSVHCTSDNAIWLQSSVSSSKEMHGRLLTYVMPDGVASR